MDPDTLGVKIEDDDEDKALDEGLLAAKDLLKKRQRQKREASEHNSSGDLKKKEHVKTDNSAQEDAKDKVVEDEKEATPIENGEEEEEPPTPPPIETSPPPEEPGITDTSKEKGDKSKRTGKLPTTWEKKESPEPDQEEQKVERKVGRLKFEAKKEREKGPVDIPKQETIDDFRNARQMLRKRAPPDETKKTVVQSEGLGFSVVK